MLTTRFHSNAKVIWTELYFKSKFCWWTLFGLQRSFQIMCLCFKLLLFFSRVYLVKVQLRSRHYSKCWLQSKQHILKTFKDSREKRNQRLGNMGLWRVVSCILQTKALKILDLLFIAASIFRNNCFTCIQRLATNHWTM